MIYLDVTSACQSALNTGVKRIQRGMHASLRHRADYHPLRWQSARRVYRSLTEREMATLEMRDGAKPRGLALFDSLMPGLLRDTLEFFPLEKAAARWRDDDILLLPDLLWDNRGNFLRTLRPVRKVGVFHDAIALRHPEQSRLDGYFCRRGLRALAALDGVLCISREAQDDLHHYWREAGLDPAPTFLAPWPVPFHDGRPDAGPNFGTRRLLCVARFEPHKNHLALLAACEMLWREGVRFELQLIGCLAYPDDAWRIWRRLRALRRAGRSVSWQRHVGEAQLHAAYRDCSATVFPSLMEGFGLPILESLWHGRPVVCGDNGALGEVEAGGGCQTADMRDPAAIASALRRTLTEPRHYEALCAEAQARRFRTWSDYWAETTGFIGMKTPVLESAENATCP